jgi:hypothetical protein
MIASVRTAVISLVAVCVYWLPVRAVPQSPPELAALMTRIGERVASYYRRAQAVVCVESSTVQPISSEWSSEGFARTVESDLRVDFEAADGYGLPEATVHREPRRVNGRAPRERDKKDRSGCTDPNPLSPAPLAFLLPSHRDEYRFVSVREGKEQDRAALIIDFLSAERRSKPVLIEDAGGHDDCFDWSGPVATGGRVWIDPSTDEVLRVERHLTGPTDIRVPWALQRRYNFGPYVVLDRDDLTLRYKPIAFSEPAETMLLPESIDSVTVIRGGLQSIRRTQTFSDYRRFVTEGHIIKKIR